MNSEIVFGHAELKKVLQGALGEERAELAIPGAAEKLGCLGLESGAADALGFLGAIADHGGLVGISARFGRSRLMSRITAKSLEAHGSAALANRGSS